MDMNRVNPYHHDLNDDLADIDYGGVPFAGRKDVLGHLHRQFNDPAPNATRSLCIVGRQHIGKTAVLLAAEGTFADTHVVALLFMREAVLDSELDLILAIAQAVTEGMVASGVSLQRLMDLEEPTHETARTWLAGSFLPIALAAMRGRKLALCFDDAERMLFAIRSGALPPDTFSFLHGLIRQFGGLGMALTLDAEYEADVDGFAPLIGLKDTHRLNNLSESETRWLLTGPAVGCYSVGDDAVTAAQKLTGGEPALVQHLGYLLFRRWETVNDLMVVSPEDIRSHTAALYRYAEADFRAAYLRLTPPEKRVLGAVSQLHYSDPLKRVDPGAIENFLAQGELPMDMTAIRSALRGLEYVEMAHTSADGVTLVSGLMQSWLLDNVGTGRVVTTSSRGPALAAPVRKLAEAADGLPRAPGFRPAELIRDPAFRAQMQRQIPARMAAAMALAAAILGLLLAVALFSPPAQDTSFRATVPTVTLADAP
ncbi:MAG: hypothetical protein KME04_09320 [Pleurocapsa minor GSE-CHR-MK-17-07R]|jgi:hypothetical protein|nr:hypothetical protein [Pleurocapsa minor GSE-CHR-MK 17-07R]